MSEYQFELKISNNKVLKGIIETLGAIVDETEIKITPTEFMITAMDPSRICLLKFVMKKEYFDEYECKKEAKIGVNLDDLDKILKRSNQDDNLILLFDPEKQQIKIKMRKTEGKRTRTFSLALLDIDAEEIPFETLLKIQYDSKFEIDPSFLLEAIKDAEIYSEIINMKAFKEGLNFSSIGQIGEMNYELNLDELINALIEQTTTGAYSIRYLKAILKLAPITEKLNISLKTDHPIKMEFTLLEGSKIEYFLAPRVEEAEFEDEDLLDEEF